VGIGVNCTHHPPGMEYPATDLAAAGARVTPEALFRALSRTILARLAEWGRGRDFGAIRAAWLARPRGAAGGDRAGPPRAGAGGTVREIGRDRAASAPPRGRRARGHNGRGYLSACDEWVFCRYAE